VGTDRGHGMTPWAPANKQAVGKLGWAGQIAVATPVGLKTWYDTCALKELAGWAGWVGTVTVSRAQFQGLNILFQYFRYSKFEKYKSCTFLSPNFSKLYQVIDNFNGDKSPFGKKFRFPTTSELKIQERKPI
jgi:hypothetical protein